MARVHTETRNTHAGREAEWDDRQKQNKKVSSTSKGLGHLFRDAGLPAQAPESEAQAAVGVQTDGDLPGRVELTLQFDGATQGTGGRVRHLGGGGTRRRDGCIKTGALGTTNPLCELLGIYDMIVNGCLMVRTFCIQSVPVDQ